MTEKLTIGARIEELKRPEAEERAAEGRAQGRKVQHKLASSTGGGGQNPREKREQETAALAGQAVAVRRRAPLSVRVDDGLAEDLAVMARAGLSASSAVRMALSIVAGAYEAAWATGAVPEGVQPEITGCTGLRMTPVTGRMTQVRKGVTRTRA